jgi:putative ABC transport system substrate-binding protein
MNTTSWIRAACVLAILAGALVEGQAQTAARVPRVGILELYRSPSPPSPGSVLWHLQQMGYVTGQNVVFERRAADGHGERLPELAAELVRERVDAIVAFTNVPAFAAKAATSTIPIVVWGAHAAVDTGLVAALAHPGGNVTGVESLAPELDAKRLEVLKEIVPGLSRLSVLYNPSDPGSLHHLKSVQSASRALGLTVAQLEVRRAEDYDATLAQASARRPEGLVMFTDPLTFVQWKRVAEFALANRIPTVCEFRQLAQAGCLIAYGPTFDEFAQRSARQIDLILRGTKPADLPFEQVTRFELVVNLKTARAIGVTIPYSILLRASEVIE